MTATTPTKPASAQGAVAFQPRVQTWMMACFGAEISADVVERNHRFLEEALELVQSTGCTASEAHQLVDYVFDRDIGETHQEIGGVMVTLAALCLALGQDMHKAGETELARIWTKVEKIRAKQAAKPKHSPLPQHVAAAPEPAASPPSPVEWRSMLSNMVDAMNRYGHEIGDGDIPRAHRDLMWRAEQLLANSASPPSPVEVRVKTLAWREELIPPCGEWLASSSVGLYCIPLGRMEGYGLRFRDREVLGNYGSLKEAKAAAQADYESRIRSALASDATANCCHCGRIVDTREKEQGGDDFGCQLTDGRWTCSPECWEAVVEPDATANSQKPYAYAWRYADEVTWHLSFDKPRVRYHDDIEYHELFLGSTANSKVRDEDVRGAWRAGWNEAIEAAARIVTAEADITRTSRPGRSVSFDRVAAEIRARTLATPETESRDATSR